MPEPDREAHPGGRLGLPETGPGSMAPFHRRLGALAIDWLACLVLARSFTRDPWGPLAVFAVENLLLVSTLGATFGMRLLGLRVVRLGSGAPPSPLRVALRTLLLCAVVPAVVWDRDGRGLHDKAAGSAVLSTRR